MTAGSDSDLWVQAALLPPARRAAPTELAMLRSEDMTKPMTKLEEIDRQIATLRDQRKQAVESQLRDDFGRLATDTDLSIRIIVSLAGYEFFGDEDVDTFAERLHKALKDV